MMAMQDYLRLPGAQAVVDSAEANVLWNKGGLAVYDFGGIIDSTATDSGGSPTTTLRTGLLLGKKTSSGNLFAWSATATDGTQYVYGVLPFDVNMLDISAAGQIRILSILIGGWVKNGSILNLDAQARQQMRGRFWFDDDFNQPPPGLYFPWRGQLSKTANYTALATDNGVLFDNTGAAGAVTFTLPAIADGLKYGFLVAANQNVLVTSAEGSNIIAPNNASASTLSFVTAGDKIGGFLKFYTNPGATKWVVEKVCSNAMTIA